MDDLYAFSSDIESIITNVSVQVSTLNAYAVHGNNVFPKETAAQDRCAVGIYREKNCQSLQKRLEYW